MYTVVKTIIILLFPVLFLYGCSEKKAGDNGELNFDLSGISEQLSLTSVADSVSYIQFEATEESLIGLPYRIQFMNDKYFIYDFPSKSILVFDGNGKYLSKLNKYGQGPGEYIAIESFCVDNENNIYILDTNLNKILKYNVQGEFLQTMCEVDDFPRSDIAYIDGHFILTMPDYVQGKHKRGIYTLDPQTNQYTQIIQIENTEGSILEWYFQPNNEEPSEIFVTNNYDHLFYKIKNSNIQSTKRINITPETDIKAKKGYELSSCIETQKWYIIIASSFQTPKFIFYNKETNNRFACDIDRLTNDIDNGNIGFPKPIVFKNSIATLIADDEDTGNPKLQIWHLK